MSDKRDETGRRASEPWVDPRAAEARIRALLEAALDGIVAIDEKGIIESASPSACRMFGYEVHELVGQNVRILAPSPHRESHDGYLARYLATGRRRMIGQGRDLEGRRKDGSHFPLHLSVGEASAGGRRAFVGLVKDLTAQRRLEDELRAAGSSAALAEDRERRRLAHDLHDDVGQILALARMKLGSLRGLARAEGLAPRLREIEEIVYQAQQHTDSVTFQLSPPVLHDVGLEAGLEWLAGDMSERYGLGVRVEDDGRPKPLEEALRVTLYRAARELLINVVKHAQTDEAWLRLEREDDSLRVVVEDRGVGFDPGEDRSRFGLISIRERLSHLGGAMEVEAIPGDGTRVTLTAPLAPGSGGDP